MKLIVGLGNPGKSYEATRHNVGFHVVDRLARKWAIGVTRRRHEGLCGEGGFCGEKVILLKPQTYMNRSGQSVAGAVAYYGLGLSDILVIVDDTALPLGRIRLRPGGSAGGHHGLQDIIDRLGTSDFPRLRVGIGAAPPGQAVEYVLGRFPAEQQEEVEAALARAAAAATCWVTEGLDRAMTRFNAPGCQEHP